MWRTYFNKSTEINHPLIYNYKTNLPVIDSLLRENKKLIDKKPLENTAIVYVHHALQTSINVVHSLVILGAKPSSIFILGKSYSENKEVVSHLKALGVHYIDSSNQIGFGEYKISFRADINNLWVTVEENIEERIKDILIIDHGGHAIQSIPSNIKNNYKLIGIEKTTAGTMGYDKRNKPIIPIINVAGCAAKRILESPLIADAVSAKVASHIKTISHDKVCAVIGYGA